MIDEKRVTGVSYIFSFYIGIQNLTDTYGQYLNLMLELESKTEDVKDTEQGDKQVIAQFMQTVRLYAHKCYIQYKNLIPSLKIDEDKEIDENYNKIASNFVIDRNILKDFVMKMNKVLVNGVIQHILTSNQDFIQDIYKNE